MTQRDALKALVEEATPLIVVKGCCKFCWSCAHPDGHITHDEDCALGAALDALEETP